MRRQLHRQAAREAFAAAEKLLTEVGDPGLLEALELAVAEYARRVRRFGGRPDLEAVSG